MAVGNRFAIYITHPGNAMGGLINMDVSEIGRASCRERE